MSSKVVSSGIRAKTARCRTCNSISVQGLRPKTACQERHRGIRGSPLIVTVCNPSCAGRYGMLLAIPRSRRHPAEASRIRRVTGLRQQPVPRPPRFEHECPEGDACRKGQRSHRPGSAVEVTFHHVRIAICSQPRPVGFPLPRLPVLRRQARHGRKLVAEDCQDRRVSDIETGCKTTVSLAADQARANGTKIEFPMSRRIP